MKENPLSQEIEFKGPEAQIRQVEDKSIYGTDGI